jgi:starvation-inducible DNA-binding protein
MAVNPSREHHASRTLQTPTDYSADTVATLSSALNALLADTFALFLKKKSFHWHVSGPHFRDYHLLFEEQAKEVFAMTDVIAERVRVLGGTTIRSIGHIAKLQRLNDSDEAFITPGDMMRELMEDNRALINSMREVHSLCGQHGDVATVNFLDEWIHQAEERVWFLFETSRGAAH